MEEYEIREITSGDFHELAELIREGFRTVAEDFGLTRENCASNGAFIGPEKLMADRERGNKMYVLSAGGRDIGFVQAEKASGELFYIEKITVLPGYRHLGYGKAMLDFIKARISEWGGKKISIGIIEENKILKDWYAANGFVPAGIKKFAHLPFTVGFMECNLS